MTSTRTWRPLCDVPLGRYRVHDRDPSGRLRITVDPVIVEGITRQGVRVPVTYKSNGDYEDRWVDRHGQPVWIVGWRPLPA